MAAPATAAPGFKLKTFGTGEVTVTSSTSATIVNDAGEFGGVYLQSKSESSKPLDSVDFQFRSTGDVGGGAPRFSIPIDDPATGTKVDGYAFLDVNGGGGDPTGVVPTLVSTQAGNCQVFFNADTYANWTAFAAANPTFRTSPGHIPFIIADAPGSYEVDGIVLRTK